MLIFLVKVVALVVVGMMVAVGVAKNHPAASLLEQQKRKQQPVLILRLLLHLSPRLLLLLRLSQSLTFVVEARSIGGGRGIAVTAKGGQGRTLGSRPHNPNEANGSWSVMLVVIVPVVQMLLFVGIIFCVRYCCYVRAKAFIIKHRIRYRVNAQKRTDAATAAAASSSSSSSIAANRNKTIRLETASDATREQTMMINNVDVDNDVAGRIFHVSKSIPLCVPFLGVTAQTKLAAKTERGVGDKHYSLRDDQVTANRESITNGGDIKSGLLLPACPAYRYRDADNDEIQPKMITALSMPPPFLSLSPAMIIDSTIDPFLFIPPPPPPPGLRQIAKIAAKFANPNCENNKIDKHTQTAIVDFEQRNSPPPPLSSASSSSSVAINSSSSKAGNQLGEQNELRRHSLPFCDCALRSPRLIDSSSLHSAKTPPQCDSIQCKKYFTNNTNNNNNNINLFKNVKEKYNKKTKINMFNVTCDDDTDDDDNDDNAEDYFVHPSSIHYFDKTKPHCLVHNPPRSLLIDQNRL